MSTGRAARILILGASGFLGGHVYRQLQGKPEVQVMGTSRSQALAGLLPLDVLERRQVAALVAEFQPTAVLWAVKAAHTKDGPPDESPLIDQGLRNVLAAVSPSAHLVFVSSDAVFGRGRGRYREDDPPEAHVAGSPTAAYAAAKVRGEAAVQRRGGHWAIVRVGPLYGRWISGVWDRRTAAIMGELRGEGHTVARAPDLVKSFVRVEDAAQVLAHVLVAEVPGILHVAADPASFYELAVAMAEASGYPASRVRPEPAAGGALLVPRDTSLMTERAPLVARVRQRLDFSDLSPD